MIKHIFYSITLLLFVSILPCNAQEWFLDIEEAKTESEINGKPILLVFQGSDWCSPCIKLEKEVWQTKEFQSYASDHLVLLQADFPRRKKNALSSERQRHNNHLAEKYNHNGIFPFVVLLSPKGEVIGETGYKNISAQEYIDHLMEMTKS